MLDKIDTRALVLVVAVLVFLSIGAGFRVARYRKADAGDDAPFGIAEAAAFGLVALLLGFSYSLALSRFDARRAVTVREANAIGTTILRTELFDRSRAHDMKTYLRRYVDARIEFAEATNDAERREHAAQTSRSLQQQMWTLTMSAARLDEHSTMIPLFIVTLNETIDASAEQAAVLSAHIPDRVIAVLVAVIIIAAFLFGLGFGRTTYRGLIASVMFALMFGVVVETILDLDQPQEGVIRVPLDSLRALQRSF
jgi:hypothetical protein